MSDRDSADFAEENRRSVGNLNLVVIFPIPLAHSLAACACAFFSACYLAQGSFGDRFMQLFLVNSIIAVTVAAPVKYFFFAARKAEYIARRRLEAANREISGLYERLHRQYFARAPNAPYAHHLADRGLSRRQPAGRRPAGLPRGPRLECEAAQESGRRYARFL